jgi:hypothetical protein
MEIDRRPASRRPASAEWAPAHSSGNGALFRHFETI